MILSDTETRLHLNLLQIFETKPYQEKKIRLLYQIKKSEINGIMTIQLTMLPAVLVDQLQT